MTPFTGVFCNVLAYPESSHDDLRLLEDFVTSLQPAVALSEGVEKFHQLCLIFVNVAKAFVQAKARQRQSQVSTNEHNSSLMGLQTSTDQFDELSAALCLFGPDFGFPQDLNVDGQVADDLGVTMGGMHSKPAIQPSLYDWQSGKVSLYGLLDQDLNDLTNAMTNQQPHF